MNWEHYQMNYIKMQALENTTVAANEQTNRIMEGLKEMKKKSMS